MQIDPKNTDQKTLYKIITGVVIPRPIGWISTQDEKGINNLAPFSYFNLVSEDPPHIMFSTVRSGNKNKNTLDNILANKQFVVNFVSYSLAEQMNITAQAVAAEIDEFELAGLSFIDSSSIKPKRVAKSLVHFECEMVHNYSIENPKTGGACVIIGKIIMIHIDDTILLENYKINREKYAPIARLSGSDYCKIGEIFQIKRSEYQ